MAETHSVEQWMLEPHPVVFIPLPDPERVRAWARARVGGSYFTDPNPRARLIIERVNDHG